MTPLLWREGIGMLFVEYPIIQWEDGVVVVGLVSS